MEFNFSNDWQGTDKPYTVTEDKFAKQYDLNYTVKNRSAICNYEGKILNDVSLPCIGKFIGKYAITCRTIEFENNKIKLKGIGVIDIMVIVYCPMTMIILNYSTPNMRV